METTTEALLKVLEANLELGNERQVVLLIGQLLRNSIISLQVFWDELVLPLFEIIDELVLDMPFVISSFVVFFGKLIKQTNVNFLLCIELYYFIFIISISRCFLWKI